MMRGTTHVLKPRVNLVNFTRLNQLTTRLGMRLILMVKKTIQEVENAVFDTDESIGVEARCVCGCREFEVIIKMVLFQSNTHFMRKIPPGAEASNILVGELDYLERTVAAFVRLNQATFLGDITEVPVPTRFLFILLGPTVQFLDFLALQELRCVTVALHFLRVLAGMSALMCDARLCQR